MSNQCSIKNKSETNECGCSGHNVKKMLIVFAIIGVLGVGGQYLISLF